MTLEEAMKWADESAKDLPESSIVVLTAEVRRLQSEVAHLPARRPQPTAKTAPIAPPNLAFFGIDETDEEFAERAGRKVEVTA